MIGMYPDAAKLIFVASIYMWCRSASQYVWSALNRPGVVVMDADIVLFTFPNRGLRCKSFAPNREFAPCVNRLMAWVPTAVIEITTATSTNGHWLPYELDPVEAGALQT